MKKINWSNLIELIVGVVCFIGMIVFSIILKNTEIPLNILLCIFICNVIWLSIGFDIYEKIRG